MLPPGSFRYSFNHDVYLAHFLFEKILFVSYPEIKISRWYFPGHMRLKKHGITIDCEHCVYCSSDREGTFEITVPIIDSETGISDPANLRCTVSPNRHTIELLEWSSLHLRPTRFIEGHQQRVLATLTFLAEHKVCGNLNICPSKVIQIVEENRIS